MRIVFVLTWLICCENCRAVEIADISYEDERNILLETASPKIVSPELVIEKPHHVKDSEPLNAALKDIHTAFESRLVQERLSKVMVDNIIYEYISEVKENVVFSSVVEKTISLPVNSILFLVIAKFQWCQNLMEYYPLQTIIGVIMVYPIICWFLKNWNKSQYDTAFMKKYSENHNDIAQLIHDYKKTCNDAFDSSSIVQSDALLESSTILKLSAAEKNSKIFYLYVRNTMKRNFNVSTRLFMTLEYCRDDLNFVFNKKTFP